MPKRLIGIKELSEYISIPVGSLYVWTCMKKIPYIKLGRRVMFDLKDIDTWVDKKKVKVFKYKEIEI